MNIYGKHVVRNLLIAGPSGGLLIALWVVLTTHESLKDALLDILVIGGIGAVLGVCMAVGVLIGRKSQEAIRKD